jgi:DNA-binding transcriptional LysR family regulator
VTRWAAMEAFVRVVETGSFSAAARQLHLGQPAVSKMIAQLEERLGVQLLLRSTQGLTSTEAAESPRPRAPCSASDPSSWASHTPVPRCVVRACA